MTGKDLGLKPSTVEQARFEYSPLSRVFNKGLKKEEKKEGLLKRLKNIEDKNEEQLKAVKNKAEKEKEVTNFVKEPLSLEANGLIEEVRIIQKDIDYRKWKTTGGNKVTYDFSDYKTFKELFRDLYYRKITIDEAERKVDEFDTTISALSKSPTKKKEYIEAKNKLLINVKKFYKRREKIIEGFKDGKIPISRDEEEEQRAKYEEELQNIRNENGLIDYRRLQILNYLKRRGVNDELVKKYFQVHDLRKLLQKLQKSKNSPKKNKILKNLINSGLWYLKEDTEVMNKQEKETENPNEIVDIVENILEFNRQQQGQGLKILTPNQMLGRLPISLAQSKAENNSEKLENEIRQLLYSLYRSKKNLKQLWKSLTDII